MRIGRSQGPPPGGGAYRADLQPRLLFNHPSLRPPPQSDSVAWTVADGIKSLWFLSKSRLLIDFLKLGTLDCVTIDSLFGVHAPQEPVE